MPNAYDHISRVGSRCGAKKVGMYSIHSGICLVKFQAAVSHRCMLLCQRQQERAPRSHRQQSQTCHSPLAAAVCKLVLYMQDRGTNMPSKQVQYSLLYRASEKNSVKQACEEGGTTLVAYSPLAQGSLCCSVCRTEGQAWHQTRCSTACCTGLQRRTVSSRLVKMEAPPLWPTVP